MRIAWRHDARAVGSTEAATGFGADAMLLRGGDMAYETFQPGATVSTVIIPRLDRRQLRFGASEHQGNRQPAGGPPRVRVADAERRAKMAERVLVNTDPKRRCSMSKLSANM